MLFQNSSVTLTGGVTLFTHDNSITYASYPKEVIQKRKRTKFSHTADSVLPLSYCYALSYALFLSFMACERDDFIKLLIFSSSLLTQDKSLYSLLSKLMALQLKHTVRV